MNLAMMYLLDMGKVSFLYPCIMNLLHVLHALIRSFVDKITCIKVCKDSDAIAITIVFISLLDTYPCHRLLHLLSTGY